MGVVGRMALDDGNAGVVAAAAELLLCLLGGPEQEATFEAADAHPYTGEPGRALKRLSRSAAW